MSVAEPLSGRTELPAVPASACAARRWLAGQLAGTCPADLVDTAVLLASELVTNAVRACAGAEARGHPDARRIGLTVTRARDTLRIEVTDAASGALPAPPGHPDADAESGRGLQVVTALATRWGWRPAAPGKAVWCELPAVALALAPAVPGDPALARHADPAARAWRERHTWPVAVGADMAPGNGT